jgi:hypothetical protein
MRNLLATLLILLALSGVSKAQDRPAETSRYPNELPGLKLYAEGNWKSLEPGVSIEVDADRVLGKPSPIFIPYNEHWQVIVHYYGVPPRGTPGGQYLKGTMDSISFHPRSRFSLSHVALPKAFKFGSVFVTRNPAPYISYSDGAGLAYFIYSKDSADGAVRKGDLREIRYGVPRRSMK